MRVWVTRAQPGARRTAERLTALGVTPIVLPLLAIHPLDVTLDLTGVEALAFTSINGVTAFAALSPDRALPVFSVGDATAQAAHDAGFTTIQSANGDLAALAALIRAEASGLSILHPCAAEPAGDLAAAIGSAATIRAIPVYGARETGTPAPPEWDAVLIHSPRAARALVAAHPDTAARTAIVISIAAAAPLSPLDFADIRIADSPTETALLATLGKPGASV